MGIHIRSRDDNHAVLGNLLSSEVDTSMTFGVYTSATQFSENDKIEVDLTRLLKAATGPPTHLAASNKNIRTNNCPLFSLGTLCPLEQTATREDGVKIYSTSHVYAMPYTASI